MCMCVYKYIYIYIDNNSNHTICINNNHTASGPRARKTNLKSSSSRASPNLSSELPTPTNLSADLVLLHLLFTVLFS